MWRKTKKRKEVEKQKHVKTISGALATLPASYGTPVVLGSKTISKINRYRSSK